MQYTKKKQTYPGKKVSQIYLVCKQGTDYNDEYYSWTEHYSVVEGFRKLTDAFLSMSALFIEQTTQKNWAGEPIMTIKDFDIALDFDLIEWCEEKDIEYNFGDDLASEITRNKSMEVWDKHIDKVLEVLSIPQAMQLWADATGNMPVFIQAISLVEPEHEYSDLN